ncbi:MAG: hypothetical protein ACI9QL_001755 [Candidatus Omnitrophota bacterium]|jgi:hypothetical protein
MHPIIASHFSRLIRQGLKGYGLRATEGYAPPRALMRWIKAW